MAVAIPPDRLPEPDIVVTNFIPKKRAPVPVETVPLLVEVSDTTLQYDLITKQPLYASGNVPEYWVADLEGRVFHRMWSPAGDRYLNRDKVDFGSPLTSMTIVGVSINTAGL